MDVKIFDAHCDVLYKLFMNNSLDFTDSPDLQVTWQQLSGPGPKVQCFAIYVPEKVHPDLKFQAALHMVELFYERIIEPFSNIKMILTKDEIMRLTEHQIGAILTLEGCDAIGSDINKLQTLLRLGVSSVGLTWNYANSVADGVLEERGAGLSRFGKQVVDVLNNEGIWCDVSHLSEKGFWDVIDLADYPIASHSNCYALCPHPRNLRDEQIKALIDRNSVLGITFVSPFLSGTRSAMIADVLRHLDHVCALGGENHVGFGSDFDGSDDIVTGLERMADYSALVNELYKYYSNIQVDKFLYQNFAGRYPR
ncbi:dipeptidase [Bacillus canaveralius]|uniref:dipeptidase n=1 Tax=Bacillus canaveralius TaxID=1403243 RepID=UPI00163B317F|nr:dipeptidase [Bacillus canaveralius]